MSNFSATMSIMVSEFFHRKPGGFAGKFFWAGAAIDGNYLAVVSLPEVPAPTRARYARAQNPQGCRLYNPAGLPAFPFRMETDRELNLKPIKV